ncbi:MAG TPA: hypothetical protein EYO90_08515, partial [Candidatus Latescibacteria bacterium]|nr:hypothetical protein [Candidatus Latescibacterota bacterium]
MADENTAQGGNAREHGAEIEKGVTRRHTFFCVERKRHIEKKTVIEAVPKTITVCGRQVEGWLITTEEQVIDKTITLAESMEGLGHQH